MEPDSPSSTPTVGSVPAAAQERVMADASAAADQAQETFETVKHEATEQLETLKEQAAGQIAEATDKAKSFAAEQKDFAGDQLGGIANAISKVAGELEGSDQATVAGYARDLAGGMKSVSESVKARNVDELVAMAEDFGRKQPLAFLGAAALGGFVASRFVLASAQRRTHADTRPAPRQSDPVRYEPEPPIPNLTAPEGEF